MSIDIFGFSAHFRSLSRGIRPFWAQLPPKGRQPGEANQEELLESIAEIERGEFISGEQLLERLRRFG